MSNLIADILQLQPYGLDKREKENLLNPHFSALCKHHYEHCMAYQKMLDALGFDVNTDHPFSEIPFLPVRLFKLYDLVSIPERDIFKTITSSGTSGQSVSRIFLNKETAANQTKVLTRIVSSFIGSQRLPMIIVDSESILKDRNLFSARGAGIMGFSLFGSQRFFALDENMDLKTDQLFEFVHKNEGSRILIFGFTFMVYQHFLEQLVALDKRLDMSNAILIHGGGWKNLQKNSFSPVFFREKFKKICGITNVHDYYGMAEQTGSIFMECEEGHLHAPVFGDVIIRYPNDFSICGFGEPGIIQVLSVIPDSYPGHSLLTEDEGILLGEDDCPCGRLGKYFQVTGRLKQAEMRGCSDTYAESHS